MLLSIAIVRAAVQWLSYRLGIISNALEVNCRLQWWCLLSSMDVCSVVTWWCPQCCIRTTRYTSKAHIARVLLERILLPIERDVIDSMHKDYGAYKPKKDRILLRLMVHYIPFVESCRLPISTYLNALKLSWLIENVDVGS